ncbi:hypothetical protein K0A97_01385 [Patescibacteria group bacterium]|nr:hypothetical protein [Patescibacteria group bacterium]
MRNFVYFSGTARTSGNFDVNNLMKSGRMDIVVHFIINTFFLSHNLRDDVKLHLIFYGPPDPPKHIEIQIKPDTEISKKDVANLIKKILYKYKPNQKIEAHPGCYVEKKSLLKLIDELLEEEKEIFILEKDGKPLRDTKIPEDSVFIIGDHLGLPKKELKRLRGVSSKISAGPVVYFASQIVTILNNELDIRGL